MSTLELILSAVSTVLTASNVVEIFYIRATRKRMQAEASEKSDAVLYKRIAYLDERVSKLEELACFDKDCKYRK
ncbi:MAG: hypothetical protein EOL95_09870 [Bacteroidia bacterium]|nr:hypothetical protein [Bacteroidia bacterium]